jgi:epsilon-lactone hydrolase
VKALLRIGDRRAIYDDQFARGEFDDSDVAAPPMKLLGRACTVTPSLVANRNCYRIVPNGGGTGKWLFVVHGGGFVHNMQRGHWQLVKALVTDTGRSALVIDYPLAPAGHIDDAHAVLRAAWDALAAEVGADNIAVMGDSAGGCLALGLAQTLSLQAQPLPEQLILLSPLVDSSLANPEIAALEADDVMLKRSGLMQALRAVAGSRTLDDPLMSPLNAPVTPLPPMALFVGTAEIFLPDCRLFIARQRAAGQTINSFEYPGMFHVWVAVVTLPEARDAIDRIAAMLTGDDPQAGGSGA